MFQNLLFRLKWGLAIGGAVLLGFGIYCAVQAHKTPVDLNTIADNEIEAGLIVEGEIYGNYGAYEESYSTNNGVKNSSSTEWYYIIPVADESYMGIAVNVKARGTEFEKQADQTYDYLTGASNNYPMSLHVKGKINKMDDEDYALYKEALVSMGFTSAEISQYCKPYYIKSVNYDKYPILIILGAVMTVVGVALIILLRKKRNV